MKEKCKKQQKKNKQRQKGTRGTEAIVFLNKGNYMNQSMLWWSVNV